MRSAHGGDNFIGSAIQTKGFGCILCSFRKRLIEWNTPRFNRRLVRRRTPRRCLPMGTRPTCSLCTTKESACCCISKGSVQRGGQGDVSNARRVRRVRAGDHSATSECRARACQGERRQIRTTPREAVDRGSGMRAMGGSARNSASEPASCSAFSRRCRGLD